MIRRGTILMLAIFLSGAYAYSQDLSHKVMLSAAGVSYSGGIYYSQTIGEAAVSIINSADYTLTQGFQQPRLKLLPGTPPQGNGVKAYPNPTTDYVYVELFGETARIFKITVLSISGTIELTMDLTFAESYWHIQEIPISRFARGLYLIRVVSKDGVINRSFKIDKM